MATASNQQRLPENVISVVEDIMNSFWYRSGMEAGKLRTEDNIDLYSYPWDRHSILLLRNCAGESNCECNFTKSQYSVLHEIFRNGFYDLIYLFFKHSLFAVKILEKYPRIIHYNKNCERKAPVFYNSWTFLEFKNRGSKHAVRIFEPVSQFHMTVNLKDTPCVSFDRTRRVLRGLEAIIANKSSDTDVYKKVICLKTIYDFIREPYITSKEIADVVTCICHEKATPDILEKFRETFEIYFPHSKECYQPRTLFHLSACEIRQNLFEVGKFPHGVKHLKLPTLVMQMLIPEKPPVIRKSGKLLQLKEGIPGEVTREELLLQDD